MRETFRQSMAYLHTWLGLVLGFLLMVIFFFGSLSVFDREIDRWSVPETRAQAAPMPSFDTVVKPLFSGVSPASESLDYVAGQVHGPLPPGETLKVSNWSAYVSHRDPLIRLYVDYDVPNTPKDPAVDHVHAYGYAALDPSTGERLPAEVEDRLNLGTGFFFPMHYMLHLEWENLGIWIVGLAGMAMLAALVSGVVMHRRIFREFFTFRPDKSKQRSILDLHNMTGVLALPFLFVITLSGLLIFASLYLPSNVRVMQPLVEAQEAVEIASEPMAEHPSGQPGELASVDAMMAEAKAMWAEQGVPGEVGVVGVVHVGDADAWVWVQRDQADRVSNPEIVYFNAADGKVVYTAPAAHPIEATYDFFYGLHFQFFKHWGLRWLLFAGGLVGCACIATGFLFFVEKRRKKHAAAGAAGARIVDALAVTTVTGILVATAALLLANRVLPTTLPDHAVWQEALFWLTWIGALVHAGSRSRPVASGGTSPAWAEQAWAAAALAVAAVIANWITTGDHLIKTISEGYWPVAGVDIVLLAGAATAAFAALKLGRRAAASADANQSRKAGAEPAHV
jgi:uncharacterized iron-regulated membrane protein